MRGRPEKVDAGFEDGLHRRSGAGSMDMPWLRSRSWAYAAAGRRGRVRIEVSRHPGHRLRLRLLRPRLRRRFEFPAKASGSSSSAQRTRRMSRTTNVTIETTMPAPASARHQPSVCSKAQMERQADRASNPRTTNRSTGDVTNPHQPRLLISIVSVPAPAQASENPATAGMSTDRPHGPGGLVMHHMPVILRASMTICDGGRWRSELGCGGATWLLGPDPR